jgi:hypothetical protein
MNQGFLVVQSSFVNLLLRILTIVNRLSFPIYDHSRKHNSLFHMNQFYEIWYLLIIYIQVMSASYLYLLLDIDSEDRFRTKLYNKGDDFNFPMANIPFICPFWYLQASSFDYGKRNISVVICDRHSVAINQVMKVIVRLSK